MKQLHLSKRDGVCIVISIIIIACIVLLNVFGGAIYPSSLMPRFASTIGDLTVPKHLLAALSAKTGALSCALPLVIIAAAALAVFFFAQAVRRSLRAGKGAEHA